MSRVNVDTYALRDTRFARLGKLLGENRHAALGRMVGVWAECLERGTSDLTEEEVDIAADRDGFTALAMAADLVGECETRAGQPRRVYIRGAAGRIEWLDELRKRSREGAKRRTEQAIKARVQRRSETDSESNGAVNYQPARVNPQGSTPPVLALAPVLVPKDIRADVRRSAPDAPPLPKKRARKKPTGPEAGQAALYLEYLNRKLGSRFELRPPVVRLVARLLEDRFGQGDMRAVAAHAHELWSTDEKMARYLTPLTLLAREKFGVRLDAAKKANPNWVARIAEQNAGGIANGSSLPTVSMPGGDEPRGDRLGGEVESDPEGEGDDAAG